MAVLVLYSRLPRPLRIRAGPSTVHPGRPVGCAAGRHSQLTIHEHEIHHWR